MAHLPVPLAPAQAYIRSSLVVVVAAVAAAVAEAVAEAAEEAEAAGAAARGPQ